MSFHPATAVKRVVFVSNEFMASHPFICSDLYAVLQQVGCRWTLLESAGAIATYLGPPGEARTKRQREVLVFVTEVDKGLQDPRRHRSGTTCTRTRTCARTHIHILTRTHTHTHTHTHARTRTHTHIHTNTHKHKHTSTHAQSDLYTHESTSQMSKSYTRLFYKTNTYSNITHNPSLSICTYQYYTY